MGELPMKKIMLVIIILLMLPLTGCIKKYNLTQEQSDEVAEYMAGLVLAYDTGYDQELTPLEDLAGEETNSDAIPDIDSEIATPTPIPTVAANDITPQVTDTGADGTNDTYTLSEVIGKDNFEINYKDYEIVDTYPKDSEDAYFTLTPRAGYRLLVITFTVKNTTESSETLSLSDEKIKYQLDVNDDVSCSPLFTLLENDLRYIDVVIGSGKTKSGFLVFEVSADTDITNINLFVSKNDKSGEVVIK